VLNLLGKACGIVFGPLLLIEPKHIRRLERYYRRVILCPIRKASFVLILMAPLFAIVAQMTPQVQQEFRRQDERIRRLETVVGRIDDPDGLLKSNSRRLELIEARVEAQSRTQIEQTIQLKDVAKNVDSLPQDIRNQLLLWAGGFVAAIKLVLWGVPKIKEIATTDTGPRPPV